MKFQIVSRKDNSYRIHTGIISFDVTVIRKNNRLQVHRPANIYFPNERDFSNLVGVILEDYEKVVSKESDVNVCKTKIGMIDYLH